MILKFNELSDISLETISLENLKKEYVLLREHHIKETAALFDKLLKARMELK